MPTSAPSSFPTVRSGRIPPIPRPSSSRPAQKLALHGRAPGRQVHGGQVAPAGGKRSPPSAAGSCILADQGYFLVHRVGGKDDVLALETKHPGRGRQRRGHARRADEQGRDRPLFGGAGKRNANSSACARSPSPCCRPIPEGFFPHPLLRSPWSYQNGGEWDWIGGRLVAALYQTGFRAEAEKYLQEIVAKNLAEMNIFEWSDKGGNGQGASFYAGAAGVLGEAILQRPFRAGRRISTAIPCRPGPTASRSRWPRPATASRSIIPQADRRYHQLIQERDLHPDRIRQKKNCVSKKERPSSE